MTGAVLRGPATRRMSNVRHAAVASFWFGIYFHWIPILSVLVPYQVSHLLPREVQGRGIALVTGLGAVFAVCVPPLVGDWSDRLSTRWGRRRPIMLAGTLLNVVGLVALMLAPSYGTVILAYLVVQISNNAAAAAFTAVVPDVVPDAEFGKASGILGAMVQLGSVCGLVATLVMSSVFHHVEWTYGVLAVVIAASLVPTLWATGAEDPAASPEREPQPFSVRARRFLQPLAGGDFAWVIYTRTMITAGIWCVFPFLELFFRDVVRAPSPENFTAVWQLLVLLVATPFGLAGGWLSDRRGRKPFVYAASVAMGLVVVGFAVIYTTQIGLILLAGALYGVGYGLYFAVDWALAVDTLPERTRPAKDMGLFHVSFTLPQVVVPAIAGIALDFFNQRSPNAGYRAVFLGAIVFYVLGTVFVSRIRGVR